MLFGGFDPLVGSFKPTYLGTGMWVFSFRAKQGELS